MKTNQPAWKFTANLGDANPFNGGALLYVDSTNVYAPELVYFDESEEPTREVYRISCEQCTMLANDPATISDNGFHADKPAWFASKLQSVAEVHGMPVEDLAKQLVTSNPVERASGYIALIAYFGPVEFDQYPCAMTDAEIQRKYRAAFKRAK